MRKLLFATAMGVVLAAAGVAAAREWSDPAARMKFDEPAGWATSVERSDTFTYVVTGTANNECHFIARPNPTTAAASAAAAKLTAADDNQFGAETWTRVANSLTGVFPGNSAQFISRSVDNSGFWPIQRAELQSPERIVHGAMQLRPGMDLIAMCMTYGGPDSAERYDSVIRSFGGTNDAALQAAAAAAEGAAAAPAEEAPPAN